MTKFPRTPPRLHWVYSQNPLFFVTCCTYRRRPILANADVHAAFSAFANRAHAEFGIAIGRYVILPDHLHLFVAGPDDFILAKWVGTLKRVLGKSIPIGNSQDSIWQRGFFDHLLRSDESYSQKWDYVRENPVRAQLVENVEDWPYGGEFITIYSD
jgi:REP element-mobilizing transposase RayT